MDKSMFGPVVKPTDEALRRLLDGEFSSGYIDGQIAIACERDDDGMTVVVEIRDIDDIALARSEKIVIERRPETIKLLTWIRVYINVEVG